MEALKQDTSYGAYEKPKGNTTKEKIDNTLTEEIVIGICSPIGSLRAEVIAEIKRQLETVYGYEVEELKLSEEIHTEYVPKPERSRSYSRMMDKIQGGNELRKQHGLNSILVDLAIKKIFVKRQLPHKERVNPLEMESQRKCYIIDSLKNKEELSVLRSLYRDIFYLFSVFSPRQERIENLKKKEMTETEARELVEHDEYENNKEGQNVRNTFIEADFFVRVSNDNKEQIPQKVSRYLQLIFDLPVATPMPYETAMYAAKSAAANSACLSRQVGASITDREYRLLAEGWNDVPKYKGGVYQDDGSKDFRCWTHGGKCYNDERKDTISEKAAQAIMEDHTLGEILRSGGIQQAQLHQIIQKTLREKTPLKDLIEFSRAVHAEMLAIISGSQKTGNQMRGGKLFTTTYPCHNCARHIVAAGIEEVYYIEPYVKSLCIDLHSDSLTENENENHKVKILIYDGVAPRRYQEFFLFSRPRKQGNGQLNVQNKKSVKPKNQLTLQALATLEEQAIQVLNQKGVISNEKTE